MEVPGDVEEPLLQDAAGGHSAAGHASPSGRAERGDSANAAAGSSPLTSDSSPGTPRGNSGRVLPLPGARVSLGELGDVDPGDNTHAASILITAKTILGAGMAALPHAFALSGLAVGGTFLLGVAWMTFLTVQILTRCSEASGAFSYSGVMKVAYGGAVTVALQLCLLLRTAGLMAVYMIVVGDVLAGTPQHTGLLCDLFGGSGGSGGCNSSGSSGAGFGGSGCSSGGNGGETGVTAAAVAASGWCANRPLVIFVVLVAVIAPLVSFGKLENTTWASRVGMGGIAVWCFVTTLLVAVALATGQAQHVDVFPDFETLGGSVGEVVVQLVGIIPVIGTAYTCQMTTHFVISGLRPWSVQAMDRVSFHGINICTAAFLVVSVGSLLVFGRDVPADVLASFNAKALTPLLGEVVARAAYVAVRLGYLASVVTIYPMQMLPFREALFKLVLRRPPAGPLLLPITYASMLVLYALGVWAKSIWVPVQLIGATAGALIAFIFPGMLTLRPQAFGLSRAFVAGGWLLIVVGVLQGITGVASVLLNAAHGPKNGGGGGGGVGGGENVLTDGAMMPPLFLF